MTYDLRHFPTAFHCFTNKPHVLLPVAFLLLRPKPKPCPSVPGMSQLHGIPDNEVQIATAPENAMLVGLHSPLSDLKNERRNVKRMARYRRPGGKGLHASQRRFPIVRPPGTPPAISMSAQVGPASVCRVHQHSRWRSFSTLNQDAMARWKREKVGDR